MTGDVPSPLGDYPGEQHVVPRFIPHGAQLHEPRGDRSQRTLEVQPRVSHLELGALVTAPGAARAHARAVLAEWGLAPLIDAGELLVSELMTNAVSASRVLDWPLPLSVHIWLRADGQRLVIAVWDANPRPPTVRAVDENAETGRGLHIVEALSTHWGWYPAEDRAGKWVWCELVRQPLV